MLKGQNTQEKLEIQMKDLEIEKQWEELTDIPFKEEDNDMVLDIEWNGFPKGADREDIWHWFDEKHSKGVAYLINEYEYN